MHYFEFFSILIFLTVITVVYVWEAAFIVRFAAAKILKRRIRTGLAAKIMHFLSAAGIICFSYGYFIEPFWLEVREVDIAGGKLKNTELKIVQITDLHCDDRVLNEYKMIKIVNSLEPDVIVFTGDTLNDLNTLYRFKGVMKALKANIGKYAVMGNVDVWHWYNVDLYGSTGFKLLNRESVKLSKNGEEFFISGLSCAYPGDYYKVLRAVPGDRYNIFLYHYPDLIKEAKKSGVDLYLCGHTHGGQIALPFYGALVTFARYGKEYEAGKYTVDETVLYVNRGIGLEGGISPGVRFLVRPEITVFNIKPTGK